MPKLPRSTVSFPVHEGPVTTARARIGTKIYERLPQGVPVHSKEAGDLLDRRNAIYRAEMSAGAKDLDEAIAFEVNEKRLFLETLDKMAPGLDAKKQFADLAQFEQDDDVQLYSSQPLMVLRDYSIAKEEGHEQHFGTKENTTHFGFNFCFLLKPIGKSRAKAAISLFELDAKPWELLKKYGVTEAMQKNYCEDFLKMAAMAEHDYLHHLIDLALPHAPYNFPSMEYDTREIEPPSMLHREDYMFAMHAKICDKLFEDQPKRKTHVLEWATTQGNRIAKMQDIALKNAYAQGANPQEVAEIGKAITYLTEIYAHRMFRVLSPEDKALRETTEWHRDRTSDRPALHGTINVAKAFNKIDLDTPKRLLPAEGESVDSFETLIRHCEYQLGDTYRRTHAMDAMKLYILDRPAEQMIDPRLREQVGHAIVPLPEIVARFGEAVPYLQKTHAQQVQQSISMADIQR